MKSWAWTWCELCVFFLLTELQALWVKAQRRHHLFLQRLQRPPGWGGSVGTVVKDKAQEHYQAQDGARGEELGPVSPAPYPQHRPPTVLHNTNSTFFHRLRTKANGDFRTSWSVDKVYKELRHSGRLYLGEVQLWEVDREIHRRRESSHRADTTEMTKVCSLHSALDSIEQNCS